MSDSLNDNERGEASGVVTAVTSIAILGAAVGIAVFTFFTEPTAERAGATKKTAMLVDVVEVEKDEFRPDIVAQGTVEPAREVMLRPQVSGRVVSIDDSFVPGGHVQEGDPLLQIERADFRHDLAQRRSELEQDRAELAVARGRREAAQAEYDYLGDQKLSAENKDLLLRKPQLDAARQRVEASKAAVDQAKLNLQRTRLEAPFDAHILSRDANVGSQLSPSDRVARLVGIETYWIAIELPLSKMRWISVAEGKDSGSIVRVRNRQAWAEGTYREGRLFRRVGALEGETRMVRVLATIDDPLARREDHADKPALVVGEFVEATIQGKPLENVVRVDRAYVRNNDTVWTMEDGELRINEVEIAVQDPEYAYVSEGLDDGARVVTTQLSTVTEGAALRLEGEGESNAETDDAEEDSSP